MTWTHVADAALRDYLASHELPTGLGTEESACSIAAINLALSGELTADIPDCMSGVIARATIALQDAMPAELRNSERYKAWLPTAAGTGRDREGERLAVLMDWMWSTVLPEVQGLADENGFGAEWHKMCEDRTEEAAKAAADAAADAAAYASAYAALAARAAYFADSAARAADAAARVAAASALAIAYFANAAAYAALKADFWSRVDPISVLEKMTKLGDDGGMVDG